MFIVLIRKFYLFSSVFQKISGYQSTTRSRLCDNLFNEHLLNIPSVYYYFYICTSKTLILTISKKIMILKVSLTFFYIFMWACNLVVVWQVQGYDNGVEPGAGKFCLENDDLNLIVVKTESSFLMLKRLKEVRIRGFWTMVILVIWWWHRGPFE